MAVTLRKPVTGVSKRGLAAFLARAKKGAGLRGEVHVLVSGDAELRRLNREFRGSDKATDVLSFPSIMDGEAGDIAISAQTAARYARRLGHSLSDEIKVLTLHGVLHLAGHDHENDAGYMARTEKRLRRKLGLPVSLTERAALK
jgi:probable rRNA maturation factor